MQQICMLVPGIMGSVLMLDKDVIWPGSAASLLFPYGKMPELLRNDLVATDVIRSFSLSAQYGTLIDDLGKCGFRETHSPPTLVVCPYDWRKDNALSADVLADRLDKVLAAHGGQAEISIVAHSMGGLVSRYYLESGAFSGRPGYSAVKRLITLATPHRGAPLALAAALGMQKRLFLNAAQVQHLVSDARYPSLYQLLPPKGEPFVWDEAPAARFGAIDVYDAAIGSDLGLVSANVQSAETFRASLDLANRPAGVRYFAFSGTQQTTITAMLARRVGSKYRVRRLEADQAGDGTVPSWSGTLPAVQGRPVGGEHGTIYKNNDLLQGLAVLLGKSGVLAAAAAGTVQISLRDPVVEPGGLVRMALGFPGGAASVHGEIRTEFTTAGTAGAGATFTPAGKPRPITYSGVAIETLGFTFDAPTTPGIYRVGFFAAGAGAGTAPLGADDLFVQRT